MFWKKRVPATEVKLNGSKPFNSKGQLDAGSDAEAKQRLRLLINSDIDLSSIVSDDEMDLVRNDDELNADEWREAAKALTADGTGEAAHQIGMEMAETIRRSVKRAGFLRQLAQHNDVQRGTIPSARVPNENNAVSYSTSIDTTETQIVRDEILLPEFLLKACIWVDRTEIYGSAVDFIQSKFDEAEAKVLKLEDRLLLDNVNCLIHNHDRLVELESSTDITLCRLREGMDMVHEYFPSITILMSAKQFRNFIMSGDFDSKMFDPVTSLEIMRTGTLAYFRCFPVMTDLTRMDCQVIDDTDIYFFGSAENVAEYTDRGGVLVRYRVIVRLFLEQFRPFCMPISNCLPRRSVVEY